MEDLTKENYFQYGNNLENLVVSSSSLQHIHPSQGGSIQRYVNYITGADEKKESISLERGSLLHQYLEDSENFNIYPETRPSEAICEVIDDVYQTISLSGITPSNLEAHSTEMLRSAQKLQYGVAGRWGSDVIIKKIREKGDAYFQFLIESSGKIMVDSGTKTILYNLMSTFENDQELRRFISKEESDSLIIHKELPILFEYRGFKCKSLLDRVEIDHERKNIFIYDYKTTSKPVNLYLGSCDNLCIDSHGEPTFISIRGPFQEYHTYRQLGFYQLAIIEYLKQNGFNPKDYRYTHKIIACETISPYEVKIYTISLLWLKHGLKEIEECFALLTKGFESINQPDKYEY